MNRLSYIDSAKGILIIIVIMHHLPQVAIRICEIDSDNLQIMDSYSFLYCSFFMQAFFFITGFCTSFEKEFSEFFLRNFKTIILSGLLLSIFESVLRSILDLSFVFQINIREFVKTFFYMELHIGF